MGFFGIFTDSWTAGWFFLAGFSWIRKYTKIVPWESVMGFRGCFTTVSGSPYIEVMTDLWKCLDTPTPWIGRWKGGWKIEIFLMFLLIFFSNDPVIKLLWTETSWALWIKSQLRSSQDVLDSQTLKTTLRKKTSCGPSYTCWVLSMPSKQSVLVTWESSSLCVPSLSFSSASRTSLLRS